MSLLLAVVALRKCPAVPVSDSIGNLDRAHTLIRHQAQSRLSEKTQLIRAAKVEPIVPASKLENELLYQAHNFFVPNQDPASTDQRLEGLAENLNAGDAKVLTHLALDTRQAANERFLAVYLLGERARDFKRELQIIALQPPSDAKDLNDINVRIQAMIALEGVQGQAKIFDEIQKRQTDAMLVKLAKLGAKGARQGQPFIQKYVDMQMVEILDGVD